MLHFSLQLYVDVHKFTDGLFDSWLGQKLKNLLIDLAIKAQWKWTIKDKVKNIIYTNANSILPNYLLFHEITKPFTLIGHV